MRGEIVEGDFPKGATLVPAGLLAQDVEISWVDGWTSKTESLKGKIEKIELLEHEFMEKYNENHLNELLARPEKTETTDVHSNHSD